jgi:serine phosphatase RsbU (regulator of sigma subunit)
MARVLISRGGTTSRVVELGEVTIVGRDATADVILATEGVSRHHARISRVEEGYLVEDLWSRNGTFVNRRRVRRQILKDGDRIDVCDYALTFRLGDEESRGAPPPVVLEEGTAPEAPPVTMPVGADGSVLTALADSQELERLRARLHAIYDVMDAVDIRLTLSELLDKALDKLLEIFPQADVAFLMLKDRATETMAPRASRLRAGLDPAEVAIPTTVIKEMARKRQAVLSSAAGEDPRFHATLTIRRHRIESLMCVPLLYREEVTGLLYVDSRRAGVAFHEDDLALLSWVGKEINLALERARMQRELLHRQRLERDMHLAAELQRSFLPAGPPSVPGCEFALHHAPAAGVGGDFYDFLPLGDGKLGLVIGDVAGKGVSAALLMARLTSDIRYLSLQCPRPAELLGRLNAKLVASGPRGSFVTMVYGVLDAATRKMTVASAGHLPPLRVMPEAGMVEPFDLPRSFPLGALEQSAYEDVAIELDAGDHVVLYTDGVMDASNAEGEWYGENRLYRVIASAPREPRAMLDALLADVGSFAAEEGENDDLTVVVFRVGEPPAARTADSA